MGTNINAIKGKPRAIADRVLVSDMDFGDQTTDAGIVVMSDDGKAHGARPRWAKVYSKGPLNKDEYQVGQWILIEHGRWTRGITVDDGTCEHDLRMVENESILAYADEKPTDFNIGQEYSNGDSMNIRPEDFMR